MSPHQERSSAIDISINAEVIQRAARTTNLSVCERIAFAGASDQDYASVSTSGIQQE
jgi:PleD family two-component response regulator